MFLLLLRKLISPCSGDLDLQIGPIVFRCHLSESALDLSCQVVSISKLCLGLLALDTLYESLVCLSAVGHACTGLVDRERYLSCLVSWLMIWQNALLTRERCDQRFIS